MGYSIVLENTRPGERPKTLIDSYHVISLINRHCPSLEEAIFSIGEEHNVDYCSIRPGLTELNDFLGNYSPNNLNQYDFVKDAAYALREVLKTAIDQRTDLLVTESDYRRFMD